MDLTLDKIKQMYQFKVLEVLQKEAIVAKGKCSPWARKKEQKNEKDLVYIYLDVYYQGDGAKNIAYTSFHLEDSEGYFSKAVPPENYLEKTASRGERVQGGLLFAIYQDIAPRRLWFDTGVCYENSKDPILIDIALPIDNAETRTQFLAKEDLARCYTHAMAGDLQGLRIKPQYETETLVNELSLQYGSPYKKIENGYMLKVSLPKNKKQNIIINFSGKDSEGKDLVTIGTICGLAIHDKNDRALLKMNAKMVCGAIGISHIHGQDYYILMETFPASMINKELVSYIVQSIATKGNSLENILTEGKNISQEKA
jgi:hypothetical protein